MTPRPEPLTREQRATMREAAIEFVDTCEQHRMLVDLEGDDDPKDFDRLIALARIGARDESDADKARIVELEADLTWIEWALSETMRFKGCFDAERPWKLIEQAHARSARVLARTTRDPDARDQGEEPPNRPAFIESYGWVEADEDKPKRFVASVCFPEGPPTNVFFTFEDIWSRRPVSLRPLPPPPSPDAADASVKTAEA